LFAEFIVYFGFCIRGECDCRIQFGWFVMGSIFNQRAARRCLGVFALAVLAQQALAQTGKYGINTPLGDTYAAVTSVADEQTRIVLYRAITPDTTGVVSVYLSR
jgi:hypothetical protein